MQLSRDVAAPRDSADLRGFSMVESASRLPGLRVTGLRIAALMSLAFAAAACNPLTENLGNRVLKENQEQVQVGRTSKGEVVRLLGSPSNVAAFDPNTWYYVSARQVQYAFLKPRTVEQNVLVIRFDEAGIVREVKQLGMEDAQATTYVGRTTPTRGGEPGLLRSLYDTVMRGPVTRPKSQTRGPTD
jgi:outer membrane protein assembly factor BamE (lipoprotein component of BamABCDE complex)